MTKPRIARPSHGSRCPRRTGVIAEAIATSGDNGADQAKITVVERNSTKSIDQALADERVPLRQLPRHSPPLTNETVSSYLGVLGLENGLPYNLLPSLVKTTNTSALNMTPALTARPGHDLVAALPEFRLDTRKLLDNDLPTLPGFDGTAVAC